MRKILSMALVTALVLSLVQIVTVEAEESGMYGDFEYTAYDDYVEICFYGGMDTEIEIPSRIDGLPVTSIGRNAFGDCVNLKNITIPSSVTSIGDYAFYYCENLENITLGRGIVSIGMSAFEETALYNNSDNWQDEILYIGDCLIKADQYIYEAEIKSGTRVIADYAFEGSYGIENIIIPDSVTSIGAHAFEFCSYLTDITIPDSVTSLGDNAFCRCSNLTSLSIGKGITSIGNEVFWGCFNLTSIVIPEGVTSIGVEAFMACSDLESVTIPKSVKSIGEDAFGGCVKIKDIYYSGTKEDWSKIIIAEDGDYLLTLPVIHCSDGDITPAPPPLTYAIYDGYVEVTGYDGKLSTLIIPSEIDGLPVTKIADGAFAECYTLTRVVIPDSVTSIGREAFRECLRLTSVQMSDSVVSIGERAFYYCDNLRSVVFGIGVTSISNEMFYGCEQLTQVVIPVSITAIGNDAFRGCYSLNSVVYSGTQFQWDNMSIGSGNEMLAKVDVLCRSASDYRLEKISNDKIYVRIPSAGTYTLIFTQYNRNALKDVKTVGLTASGEEIKIIDVPSGMDISSTKIFLWNDLDNMCPLCDALEL